jgi:hypothetical protein
VATIKIGREELALIEFELARRLRGPDPHAHDDHVDSFYVLEARSTSSSATSGCAAGALVRRAPHGVTHAFANRDGQQRGC